MTSSPDFIPNALSDKIRASVPLLVEIQNLELTKEANFNSNFFI